MRLATSRAGTSESRGTARSGASAPPVKLSAPGDAQSVGLLARPPADLLQMQRLVAGPAAPPEMGASGGPRDAWIHDAARRGTSGPGGRLPYLDVIQRSFGKHDVSGIAAHTDSAARAGAAEMGAAAFTAGNHVAFAGSPSLHTAAHEAAHAVQQRTGVQLAGGVGAAGDRYERHADAVADLVVKGQSAETLLDEHAGPAAPGKVQRKCRECEQSPGQCAACKEPAGAPVQMLAGDADSCGQKDLDRLQELMWGAIDPLIDPAKRTPPVVEAFLTTIRKPETTAAAASATITRLNCHKDPFSKRVYGLPADIRDPALKLLVDRAGKDGPALVPPAATPGAPAAPPANQGAATPPAAPAPVKADAADKAAAPGAAPAAAKPTVDSYVDNFKQVEYDPDYRLSEGKETQYMKVVYDDGTSLDLHIFSSFDTKGSAKDVATSLAQGSVGANGRFFPKSLNEFTTPRLWACRHEIIEIQATAVMKDELIALSVVMFILTINPMPAGNPAALDTPSAPRVTRTRVMKTPGAPAPGGAPAAGAPSSGTPRVRLVSDNPNPVAASAGAGSGGSRILSTARGADAGGPAYNLSLQPQPQPQPVLTPRLTLVPNGAPSPSPVSLNSSLGQYGSGPQPLGPTFAKERWLITATAGLTAAATPYAQAPAQGPLILNPPAPQIEPTGDPTVAGVREHQKKARKNASSMPQVLLDPQADPNEPQKLMCSNYPTIVLCSAIPHYIYKDENEALEAAIKGLPADRQKRPFTTPRTEDANKLANAKHTSYYAADNRTKITIGRVDQCCTDTPNGATFSNERRFAILNVEDIK